MIKINKILGALILTIPIFLGLFSCQKLARPELGSDYPKDKTVTPTTSLRFYLPFDSTSTAAKQINIRFADSISSYPCFFPDPSISVITGIRGTAYQGNSSNYLQYINANDFISTASSFTIAFWEKRNGAPQGNASFFFNFKSSNGYWANASMFGLFDQGTTKDSAILKIDVIDKNNNDNWFQWTGSNRIKGVQDNQWHHIAAVYNSSTSIMTLYVDGVANSFTQSWGTHGGVNMDASKVTSCDIGGNSGIKDLGWGQNWDGGLDQFRLYNAALSASDVAALFNGKM